MLSLRPTVSSAKLTAADHADDPELAGHDRGVRSPGPGRGDQTPTDRERGDVLGGRLVAYQHDRVALCGVAPCRFDA